MVCPITLNTTQGPMFYYNLDGNVGPKSPNKADDVQFVQMAYFVMAQDRSFPQAEREIFAKVVPGSSYSGSPTDPLTLAINAHEVSRGGTRDGHVSVARGSGFYDPKHSYMVLGLNNKLRASMPNDWPRLDKHPKCPPALRAAILKICINQGVG